MKKTVVWSTLLMLALTTGASALDDDAKMSRGEKRLADINERYEATGDVQKCVPIRFLKESSIIDDQTIFFKGVGKTAYMNKLPNRCPRLSAEERFAYRVYVGQLCRNDLITVLDSFGREWASCGLGEFQEMQKKAKDKSGDKGSDDDTGEK